MTKLYSCQRTFSALLSFFNNPVWSIEQDKGYSGYAEVFQYVKEYWIILMLLSLAIKTNLLYFAWCLPFGFLLLDDSFRLHEKLGRKLSNHFNFEPMLGLRSQDTGELMVYAFYALITCIPFIASLYSSDIRDKMLSYRLMVLLIVLAFFGVIVDMISIVTESHSLGMIEDGGEMIVVSIITWLIFRSAAEEIRINTRLEKYK